MKRIRNLSLQWRITVLTALVLFGCTAAVTWFSFWNADENLLPLIVLTRDVPVDTNMIYVESPVDLARARFAEAAVAFMLILSAAGTAAAWCLAGRALQPLTRLRRQIDRIDAADLEGRLRTDDAGRDVQALTDAFNGMLARLSDSFERQKRFTANAAHELKTPLATMRTAIQVLRMDDHPPLEEYDETVNTVYACCDRLASVVDKLLLLADPVAAAKAEPVPLGPLCEAVAAELERAYDEMGIRVQVDAGAEAALGNPVLLYQAVWNLVENAFKYNQLGGTICISVRREADYVVLTVRDSGQGISEEGSSRIFEPFYREDASRSTRIITGAGLGLSLVQSIAESSGGSVTFERHEDGTSFRLTLPAAPNVDADADV